MRQLILGLLLLSCVSSVHAGPIIVGNGGGQGEYSVVFAHANLKTILRDCGSAACGLDSREQTLLKKIEDVASGVPAIVMKTEKEMGSVRFLLQGKDVWINQDHLWVDEKKTSAYGLADGVVLWIEILATREALDPAEFASIDLKVLSSLKNYVQRAQQLSTDFQSFEYLMWRRAGMPDLLLVRDPFFNEVDVTKAISEHLGCTTVAALKFFSPSLNPGPGGSGPLDDYLLTLDFGVRWDCDSGKGSSIGRAVVEARRQKPDGPLAFDPKSVFVHVETGGIH
ncbi:MAG: hypothetical protein V4760_10395 [Bdellovibrionota bacterium]